MVAQPVSTPDSNISAATVEQQQQQQQQQEQQASDLGAAIENDMASSVASSYHQQFHQHHHHYMSKKERLVATSTSKTNLYIKGLGEDTTDKDLFDLCERYFNLSLVYSTDVVKRSHIDFKSKPTLPFSTLKKLI